MDSAARAVGSRLSSFASSFQRGFSAFDDPGPEIKVSPFGPGSVSAPAGILKAITAIASARRAQENFAQARKDRQALLYKQALETKALEQRVNAPTYTYRGISGLTGSQALSAEARDATESRLSNPQPDTIDLTPDMAGAIGLPVAPDGKYDRQTVGATTAIRNLIARQNQQALSSEWHNQVNERVTGSRSRYAAAVAGIRQLDAEAARGGGESTWSLMSPSLARAGADVNNVKLSDAQRQRAAGHLGLVWPPPHQSTDGTRYYMQADVNSAMESLHKATVTRGTQKYIDLYQRSKRAAFQRTIDTEGGYLASPEANGIAPDDAPDPTLDALEELARSYQPKR